jgi:segregation and condensation protein B
MGIKFNEAIEAVLFLKGRTGSTIKELKETFNRKESEIEDSLSKLEKRLTESNSIYQLKRAEDKVRLTIRLDISKSLSEVLDRTIKVRLSKSVIETLTIIAYNQPTTRPEIERIRGVTADYAVRKLLDFELIKEEGKSDLPGNPTLYKTTIEFLELFNLETLDDLPPRDDSFDETTSEVLSLYSENVETTSEVDSINQNKETSSPKEEKDSNNNEE